MHLFGQKLIVWDYPLAIAVLIQCTKLLDIVLSPSQQKWIQDKTETLTLRLADLKPLLWFQILQSDRAKKAIADL
jgi:hypothetical protein